ncbi:condensation domain-containing protein, partial [Dolichospermum sp. ST_sed3]|nr:condensation domain-containing protein [Dolichospermum sp. ST_sed3]
MNPLEPIQKIVEDIYPLSPMQEGMLFHSLYAPRSGMYVEQLNCKLVGELNVPAFERAWQQVIQRHSILRSGFEWEEVDQPLQIVYKQVDFSIATQDWRSLSADEQEDKLEKLLHSDLDQGFDLSQPPLLRLSLIRTADALYRLIWCHHHLLMDGWSLPILLKEVFSYYEAFHQGKTLYLSPVRPYRDYIAWLKGRDLKQAEDYWRSFLMGFTAPTPLASISHGTRVSEPAGSSAGKERRRERSDKEDWSSDERPEQEAPILKTFLTEKTSQALRALAQRQQVTLNTLVQGAWALLLSRYTSETDVVFGSTVAGRPAELPGAETMLGIFINTLPVRVQIHPEQPLGDWLRGLQASQAVLRQYEYTPLVRVQEWSEVPRGQPLFESILVFENYPVDSSLREQGGSLQIRDIRHFARTNYPLTLIISPGTTIGLEAAYDSHRFDAETIQRLLGHYAVLLEGMAVDPDQHLARLPILSQAEREQLLVGWNAVHLEIPDGVLIHQLFEAQVARTPDALAVQYRPTQTNPSVESQHLTYYELDQRANQLAE